jgi:hypothetical protein
MPTMVPVICCYIPCSKHFELPLKRYNNRIKEGSRIHCSPTCRHKHDSERLSGKAWGTGLRTAFTPFKRAWKLALKRDPLSNLTLEYLKEVWDSQEGICPYTGWKLILPGNSGGFGKFSRSLKKASLDRIDSNKDYEIGNVQFVSVMANLAKCDYTHEEMVKFCIAITEKWRSTNPPVSLISTNS